jgi:hypothetical protein
VHTLLKFSLIALVFWWQAQAATLVLKKSFVESFKNRATIDVQFNVDHVKKSVNSISKGGKDGDIHISGRAKKAGLPMVVEIVNAKGQNAAIDKLRDLEDSDETIAITGVWRVWFEHPGTQDHIQGNPVAKSHDTNPDHVFEIHPITKVDDVDLVSTFKPIPSYTAYTVEEAFEQYEKKVATISSTSTSITIESKMVGYNYAEFDIEIPGTPKTFSDCVIALATVLNEDGDPHFSGLRRMVFVKGMAKIDKVKKGAQLRVLGIPRLNLERVSFLVSQNPGEVLEDVPLPYEMIIVGIK